MLDPELPPDDLVEEELEVVEEEEEDGEEQSLEGNLDRFSPGMSNPEVEDVVEDVGEGTPSLKVNL